MNAYGFRNFGFVRIALALPKVRVADMSFNAEQIIKLANEAGGELADIVVFPELCLTGYTAADLFQQELLQEKSLEALRQIIDNIDDDIVTIVGLPLYCDNQLFNCAAVLQGKVLGIIPKTYIPNYKEFYEKRWFASARNAISKEVEILGNKVPFGTDLLFQAESFSKLCFGVEICEDLWVPIPPSSYQALAGATLHLNLSASNEIVGKSDYRRALVQQQSARCLSAYAYCGAGVGESTTDLLFGGHGIIAENGEILKESARFSRENQLVVEDIDLNRIIFYRQQTTSMAEGIAETFRPFRKVRFDLPLLQPSNLKRGISPNPFVPQNVSLRDERCQEIFSIQTAALAKRMESGNIKKAAIGVSGGLDSTLALLVATKTFDLLGYDKKNIMALTMPGFATSDRTKQNAIKLCQALEVSLGEIDIQNGCLQQYDDIMHDPSKQDVVFENVQARYRTMILFNRGNQENGLVLGTGDLSEIALGWCTYSGDHLSHYNVNASIPKTLVKYLVKWAAETQVNEETHLILEDILSTPISPELTSAKDGAISQKTEDIIGPYELHDFFLYYFVRWGMSPRKILFLAERAFEGKYAAIEIKKWLKLFIVRFFRNQWKRSCMPDGPKVGSVSLSPRGDWRMPSDAEVDSWLKELEEEVL